MNDLKKIRLLPPGKENSRNSEGSIIGLKDGKLFLAYSHFYGGPADNSPAYIAGRFSEDKGKTWSNAQPTDIISPCSPATVKRIPQNRRFAFNLQ